MYPDIRKPSTTVAELGEHQSAVNGVAWAPHSACHLCTCGDDRQALIWDLRYVREALRSVAGVV